jgi:hypothetical protein
MGHDCGRGFDRMLRGLSATRSGEIERDGANVRYQVFGSAERAILLLPTWSIVHSDHWRNQVPHLAKRCTVLSSGDATLANMTAGVSI